MCIYCTTTKYRKIYENHYGQIPIDDMGRSYHIHHIDGNHSNNDPTNLMALSLIDHYNLHLKQGDIAAALRLGSRLHIPGEEKSKLARESSRRRVSNGTHHFLGGELSKQINRKRIENGTHNLLGENNPSHARVANGTHNWQDGSPTKERNLRMSAEGKHPFQDEEFRKSHNKRRVANGTHPFLGGEISKKANEQRILDGTHNLLGENNPSHRRIEDGTHNALKEHICPNCGKVGKSFVMFRHHFDKCKKKAE